MNYIGNLFIRPPMHCRPSSRDAACSPDVNHTEKGEALRTKGPSSVLCAFPECLHSKIIK